MDAKLLGSGRRHGVCSQVADPFRELPLFPAHPTGVTPCPQALTAGSVTGLCDQQVSQGLPARPHGHRITHESLGGGHRPGLPTLPS